MHSVGKQIVRAGMSAFYLSAAHRLFAPMTSGLGAVLMFHRVRPWNSDRFAPNAELEVTPAFLAAVVRRLRERNIDIVDLDEALRRVGSPGDARRFAVLTMDDGYRDNFEHAYPLLKELDCPFTVYVASGLIDRQAVPWWRVLEAVIARQDSIAVSLDGPVSYFNCRSATAKAEAFRQLFDWLADIDEDAQRNAIQELAWRYGVDAAALTAEEMMSWDQVRSLAADPMVTIGAHTISHFALAKLPESRARVEMRDGARVLEAVTGEMPRHFAFPYGDRKAAGQREYELAAELGFRTAVTTVPGVIKASDASTPTAWPRVAMDGYLQSLHYLEVCLSGVPYVVAGRRARAARRPAPSAPVKAAASN